MRAPQHGESCPVLVENVMARLPACLLPAMSPSPCHVPVLEQREREGRQGRESSMVVVER